MLQKGEFNSIPLTDSQLFLSANIFKNKVKIDFVTLKGEGTKEETQLRLMTMRKNLVVVIKSLAF